MTDTVVLLSGGMDSATALHLSLLADGVAEAVSVDYGQRHTKELEYAARLCERLGVRHDVLVVPPVLSGSSLTDRDGDLTGSQTVVANRNCILISLACGVAVARGGETIVFAAHAGDADIYHDCRPEFLTAMQTVLELGNPYPIRLDTPFLHMTKTQIVRLGNRLGVDWTLTWSCYQGADEPCGVCGACVERTKAFQ